MDEIETDLTHSYSEDSLETSENDINSFGDQFHSPEKISCALCVTRKKGKTHARNLPSIEILVANNFFVMSFQLRTRFNFTWTNPTLIYYSLCIA